MKKTFISPFSTFYLPASTSLLNPSDSYSPTPIPSPTTTDPTSSQPHVTLQDTIVPAHEQTTQELDHLD